MPKGSATELRRGAGNTAASRQAAPRCAEASVDIAGKLAARLRSILAQGAADQLSIEDAAASPGLSVHVVATGFEWIGKEANRVGESGEADPVYSAVEEFADLTAYSDEKSLKTGEDSFGK